MIFRQYKVDDYVIARARTEAEDPWKSYDGGAEYVGLRLLVESRHIMPHTIEYVCVVDDEKSPHHRKNACYPEERLRFHPDCSRLPPHEAMKGW